MSRAARAVHRSCAGPQAAAGLTASPTSPGATLPPTLYQAALDDVFASPFSWLPVGEKLGGVAHDRMPMGTTELAPSAGAYGTEPSPSSSPGPRYPPTLGQ